MGIRLYQLENGNVLNYSISGSDKIVSLGSNVTSLNVNSVKITNVANGVNPTDAVNKSQLDSIISSTMALHDYKESVKVVATSNITLSGTQTIDGVNVVAGNRVLAVGQTNLAQNGIYIVASGAWSRATDFDGTPDGEINPGNVVPVESGNAFAGKLFMQINTVTTVGTDPIEFIRIADLSDLVAGTGLTKSGNTLNVTVGNGIQIDGNNKVAIKLKGTTLSVDNDGFFVAPQGITEVEIASSVAGDGLIGGSGSALAVGAGNGIEVSANAVAVKLDGNSLSVSANGLKVSSITEAVLSSTIAGDGLVGGNGNPLAVGAGNGIAVSTDAVAVKLHDNELILSVTSDGLRTVTGTAGQILVYNANGILSKATLSGDATINSNGELTIASNFVKTDNIVIEPTTGNLNGTNAIFTLSRLPVAGTLKLYKNGVRQKLIPSNESFTQPDQYHYANGTITISSIGGLPNSTYGEWLEAEYIAA